MLKNRVLMRIKVNCSPVYMHATYIDVSKVIH